ncbi:hypothetical protein [Lysinibacillus parviboronicapiens]|uniref:hypothetical protein n=1 Tax=Lysinibacillus parviboronicapiens TaxID=436516 RepID=UPI000D341876|nr:hypothetical protein [Lysinibacillus parviboronicapiens]
MSKLKVEGIATLRAGYSVEVPYTEEQWEALSERKQNEILDAAIDWYEVSRNAEVDDIDVYDYQKVEE